MCQPVEARSDRRAIDQRPGVVVETHFRPLVASFSCFVSAPARLRVRRPAGRWAVPRRAHRRPVEPPRPGPEHPTGGRRNRLPGRPFRCPCMSCVRTVKATGEADRVARLHTAEGSLRRRLADGDGRCAVVDQVQKPGVRRSEQDHGRDVGGDRGWHRAGDTGRQIESGRNGIGGGVAGHRGAL